MMSSNCDAGEDSLRVPWTARRSNQSILKEISPGCFLEGLMLKLKLQYFGHLMQRAASLEKTLMLGSIGGRRRRGWQRMRWLDGSTDSMDVGLGRLWELVMDGGLTCCSSWGRKEYRTWLSDWTELTWTSAQTARMWSTWGSLGFIACRLYTWRLPVAGLPTSGSWLQRCLSQGKESQGEATPLFRPFHGHQPLLPSSVNQGYHVCPQGFKRRG